MGTIVGSKAQQYSGSRRPATEGNTRIHFHPAPANHRAAAPKEKRKRKDKGPPPPKERVQGAATRAKEPEEPKGTIHTQSPKATLFWRDHFPKRR